MSLVARYLERNGIPTVVMGAAKDIVEYAGVPRFLFSDFPHGPGKSLGETTSECWKGLNESPGNCQLIPGWGAGKSF